MNGGNLFSGVPAALPEEYFEVLARSAQVRVERIVSRGHCSPPDFWYDQAEHEFVVLLQGSAVLALEGEGERALQAGDWLVIPAWCRHRVVRTDSASDTVWLAVHYR